MKEHGQEQKKAAARRGSRAQKEAAAERDVLAKIAEMPEADRVLAERIHDIVKTAAPELTSKLWYGMPAYARDGKVLCHFQSAQKFKTRYATLSFSDLAALDDGAMWPTAYALRELTEADEQRISALLKKAVG
ncbi:iron chaperone [Streptomyces lydicus]|uniref:iron chaperone n=1 Tax=Streptomyces lydicus TaxID=47763 RepID=UPI0037935D2D